MANMTRREFIGAKRRSLKKLKIVLGELNWGCACGYYFKNMDFRRAVQDARNAYDKMDEITKPLA